MMNRNPSPRDLDPNFKDEPVTPDVEAPETPEEESNNIVYIERLIDANGNPTEKKHGPMPVEQWEEYARENGL
jgi:hypothetical protein